MGLSPDRAAIEALIDEVSIIGVKDAKIISKRTHKEITVDDDPEIRRMGLLKDADLSLTLVYSPGDAGQQAILVSDRNNTQCEYTVSKGAIIYIVTAGVSQISFPNTNSDENIMEVELAVSENIQLIYEGMT
ncbi:hypothetical protein M0R72_18700 [Candidatus Pacearchaeota archaeon]|jgi:hypothetical protein|nr:hypothetical protein [Candidatus Pacearchaeota archaeon]